MAAFTFDIALGQEKEFHERVNNNDPTNAALILVVLAAASIEADSVLRTYATLSALLAANPEVTNTNYARKTITDTGIGAAVVDTSAHTVTLSFTTSLQTFANIVAGDSWAKIVVCYDSDTTGGTDANIVPVRSHDLIVNGAYIVPNGNDINVDYSSGYLVIR